MADELTQEMIREVDELSARVEHLEIVEYPGGWTKIVDPYLALPGLRGFWPMSGFASGGNASDFGELEHNLTYNGNPTYNYDGLVPYIDLDGVGDYLSHVDHADFDILGTETYVAAAARGLTMGGWFYSNVPAGGAILIGKVGAVGQFAYWLQHAGGVFSAQMSVDGTAVTLINGAASATQWQHVVFRFDPSAELAIFVNGVKATNVGAIPASIFNSNANFVIGGTSTGGSLYTGRASLCWLCAEMLSDAIVQSLFKQQRTLFGV